MSQPKQPTSTPSVPASTVKPAQHEKGAASSSSTAGAATKPATTVVSGASTTSSKPSTTTASTTAVSSVTNVGASTGGAKVSGGVTTTPGSSKVTPQSTAVSSTKPEPPKVTSTVPKPTATTVVSGTTGQKGDVKAKEAKVKSELSAKASTPAPAVDPFDALAGSLPSEKPPKSPQFTGPEVTEPRLTSDVAPRCGDRDDTLPPGYRMKDMEKKMPAGQPEKPKEVSQPLSMDDAVDSLSAGFVSSPPPGAPKQEVKHETVAAANTQKSYSPAPPTQKKQDVSLPASLSPAPPADKKPKLEKPAKDPVSTAAQDVKPKTEAKKVSADKPKEDPMSPDPLDALIGTLPEAKPIPKCPELKPGEIVDEKKLKSEKGVRVGEREDTLPPEYRFKEDKNQKPPPALPKEPSMDSTQALDILSGDFTDATAAPAVHAPVPPKAQAKQPQVEDLSALDALADDFVAPAQSKTVCSGPPPAPTPASKSTPQTSEKADSMSLDALDALGDTLPEAKPVPESPKLRPEEIVDEAKLKAEKGVRVGEREDTLPPDYRFPKEDPKTQPPPPKKEPSLDPTEALDLLSGDFSSPAAAPVVQAPVPPSAPPAEVSSDFDLEGLAGDLVAPTSASKVCSSAPAPAPAPVDRQLSEGTMSAMDALSDALEDIRPVPEPAPVPPKNIVKEKEVVEERVRKPGERDDALPPEYRPTEADKKAAEEAKAKAAAAPKQPSLDDSKALDILSGDFVSDQPVAPPAPQCQAPPAKTSSSQKKPAVADIPAKETLPAKPSTDVASSSPTKKGGKS